MVGVVVVEGAVDVSLVVEGSGVDVVSSGTVVVVVSELSAATMISPTASPITRATRIPTTQRVRVSIAATLVGGPEGSGIR